MTSRGCAHESVWTFTADRQANRSSFWSPLLTMTPRRRFPRLSWSLLRLESAHLAGDRLYRLGGFHFRLGLFQTVSKSGQTSASRFDTIHFPTSKRSIE